MIQQIKVSGVPYRVRRIEGFADQTGASGTCGQETQEILIDDKLGPDIELMTIIHEGLHGGWSNSVLKELFTDKQEEHVLRHMDSMIYSIIRDNRMLVEDILRRADA